jgi:hypothetical protein
MSSPERANGAFSGADKTLELPRRHEIPGRRGGAVSGIPSTAGRRFVPPDVPMVKENSMVKHGFRRVAVIVTAVIFGSMASLYIPAARAAQTPREPLMPDSFLPAQLLLPFQSAVFNQEGTVLFG